MRKKLLVSALCMTAAMASAAPLTPEAALGRLAGENGPAKVRAIQSGAPVLRFTRSVGNVPMVYVFASRQGGFMVLSADDTTVPLLGFSDSGTLPVSEADLPDGMRYWLGSLAEQVAFNAANAPASDVSVPVMRADGDRVAIGPLVTTKWNQDAPFNDKCPMAGDTRCVTGCVATAMAQVLNYYKFPANVQDNYSYTWSNGGYSQNLSISPSIKFEWDKMLDVYDDSSSEDSREAVATLMSVCGISVNMNYSPMESGAKSIPVCRALVESFGYEPGLEYIERDYYSISEWEDIVNYNLRQYGPMYYDGASNTGGHAFVCDGYSEGYFHFNWGWGGMSDGYFLLTALDPRSQGIGGHTSGYNFSQGIVTGVSKEHVTVETTPGKLLWRGAFVINQESTGLGLDISFTGSFYNYDYRTLSGASIGIIITSENGDSQFMPCWEQIGNLQPYYGYTGKTWSVVLPSVLAEGAYTVQPACKVGNSDPRPIMVENSEVGAYIMTVRDKTAYFTPVQPAAAWAENLRLIGEIYQGQKFRCSATVTNTDDSEVFSGAVVAAILSGNSVKAVGDKSFVVLNPGESMELDYVTALKYPTDNNGSQVIPMPGTYDLVLLQSLNSGYKFLSAPIKVRLNGRTYPVLTFSDLRVPDNQNPENVTATAEVTCSYGYFGGSAKLYVFEQPTDNGLLGCDSEFIGIGDQETATAKWTFAIPGASPEMTYYASVYDSKTQSWLTDPVYFKVSAPTGIDSVEGESAVVERRYLSLSGIDLGTDKPAAGIYIVREIRADGTVVTCKETVTDK